MGRLSLRGPWGAAVFVAVYVAAAELTRGLTLDNGFTPWYPPAGLVLAYLLLAGPAWAPVALLARLLNTAIVFPDAWRTEADGVVTRALAITACYALGAHLLRRLHRPGAPLRDLALFASIGVVGVPLGAAASVAAVSVMVLGLTAADAYDAARTVWIGDAVAVSAIVPAVLALAQGARDHWRIRTALRQDRAVLIGQAVALVAVPIAALALAEHTGTAAFLSLTVVPVVWVALRGDLGLAALGLLLATIALSAAAGVTVGADARLEDLQVVMLLSGLGALYVATVTHWERLATLGLAESEQRYRLVVDQSPSLIARLDGSGAVRFANEPAWLDGQPVDWVLAPLREAWATIAPGVLADGRPVDRELQATDPGGSVRWFGFRVGREAGVGGDDDGLVVLATDLTPRRQAEAELTRERWQDPLTGLANRRRFLDLLGPLAAQADRTLGVAMVDLDGFKSINEALGHERADELLLEVARRLRSLMGGEGLAARLSADEFALAVPVADRDALVALGESLVRDLRVRLPIDGRHLLVTCSVGVAPTDAGREPVSALYDAESALHAAKEGGGDRCATFEAGRRLAALQREALMSHIRQCLDRHDIVVHYQPIVDLVTGEVRSLEALVRLPDPVEGLLLPGSFIDLVEDSGLDITLGALVLEQALHDLASWARPPGAPLLTMAVNVTSRQLTQPGYVHQVLAACVRNGVAPECVRLELTETLVMADPDAAIRALHELRAQGVQAALDDFGVGYSSIAYLQRLPVDVLKIDRTFVAGLPDDADDRAIVGLVVGLARALGLEVTAEGIEHDRQREALLELGCQLGQGFLFDRPVDALTIAERLHSVTALGAH